MEKFRIILNSLNNECCYNNNVYNYYAIFRALLIVSKTFHQLLGEQFESLSTLNNTIRRLFIMSKNTVGLYSLNYSLLGKVKRFLGPLSNFLQFNERYVRSNNSIAEDCPCLTITIIDGEVEFYIVNLLIYLGIEYGVKDGYVRSLAIHNQGVITNLNALGCFRFVMVSSNSYPGKKTLMISEIPPEHCYCIRIDEKQLPDDYKKYNDRIWVGHKYDRVHDIITDNNFTKIMKWII